MTREALTQLELKPGLESQLRSDYQRYLDQLEHDRTTPKGTE